MLREFRGHSGPVYSLATPDPPGEKRHLVVSTSRDCTIKLWPYDNPDNTITFKPPGRHCTGLAFSACQKRMFSCGAAADGGSTLAEWDWASEQGQVLRRYLGYGNTSQELMRPAVSANGYLAVGDEHRVKMWDMDSPVPVAMLDLSGQLPRCPLVGFSADSSLLAATATDNSVIILASPQVVFLFKAAERPVVMPTPAAPQPPPAPAPAPTAAAKQPIPRISVQGLTPPAPPRPPAGTPASGGGQAAPPAPPAADAARVPGGEEATEPASCPQAPTNQETEAPAGKDASVLAAAYKLRVRKTVVEQLEDSLEPSEVERLLYTSTGGAVLGLCADGIHKYWKFVDGRFKLWRPKVTDVTTQKARQDSGDPCLVLSKNDSYVLSAFNGQVSLFNMRACKVMTTFATVPALVTRLAFDPLDNNVIAVGMSDATVHIYNFRSDKIVTVLRAHSLSITGLVYRRQRDTFLSAGSDGLLCAWNGEEYYNMGSHALEPMDASQAVAGSPVQLQLSPEEKQALLVTHPRQITLHDSLTLNRTTAWAPAHGGNVVAAIYNCTGSQVFVCLDGGLLLALSAEKLTPQFCLIPTCCVGPNPRGLGGLGARRILQLAMHPTEPDGLALSLSDGSVQVVDARAESEQKVVPEASEPAGDPDVIEIKA